MPKNKLFSRRAFVVGTVGVIGGATLIQRNALAQTKTSQAESEYQGTPKGSAKCSNCQFFVADSNTCAVVDGTVAAEGWCNLYNAA